MTLKADVYRLKIRFGKLFADPRIFDSPRTFARDYLRSFGLSQEKAEEIYETTEDVNPLDDSGRPSVPVGTGKFQLEGKTLRSEYMQGANVQVEYSDFGSGLQPEEHRRYWQTGKWDDLAFQVKAWHHQQTETGLANVSELYEIVKTRATPTTIATIELPANTGSLFNSTVRYLADHLDQFARKEGGSVEVYAARDLESAEKKALETRLGQQSTASTVYVILSSKITAE
jgi:hypothetical protein